MKLNKLNIEVERRDTMSPSNLFPELLVTKQTGINPVGWIHYWNLISLKKKQDNDSFSILHTFINK